MQFRLLSLFVLFSIFVVGQNYDYKIRENKIEKYATDLSFVVNPLYTDVSKNNIVGGYGIDFLLRLNTIMSFRGNYTGSYFNKKSSQENKIDTEDYNGIVSSDYVPFQYFHGEITLYLYTDVYESNMKVGIPVEARDVKNKRSYLEIDKIDKMRQVGLRFGGGKYQGQLKEKTDEFYGVDDNKGYEDPNRTINFPLDNPSNDNLTSVSYDLISAGLSYESVSHLRVKFADSMGAKNKMSQWIIYGDALYGMNFHLGDLIVVKDSSNVKETVVYGLDKFTEIAPIGFRFGFEHNVTSTLGWSYGLEIGSRPGTGTFPQRIYVAAKFGVSLNFKTMQY
jgi:hypothetical protein